LVEDDSVTGSTINKARELLGKKAVIDQLVLLSDFGQYQGTWYHDVVDMRDFLFGSRHGGLTVKLIGDLAYTTYCRAPYVYPFVDLKSRAKIPAEFEIELSRKIVQANIEFFADTGIKIQNTDLGFSNYICMLGLDNANQTMEQFCRDLLKNLETI
jgi:hypothetical protein